MFFDHVLGDEIIENGGHVINGDGRPGHTQDSVNFGGSEIGAEFGDFSEGDFSGGKSSELDLVLRKESTNVSRSVADDEFLTIGDVGGGGVGVIFLLEDTDNTLALGGGHPKIGGTSIENDGERLLVGPEGDLPEVLGVFEVLDVDFGSGSKSILLESQTVHGRDSSVSRASVGLGVGHLGDVDTDEGESGARDEEQAG